MYVESVPWTFGAVEISWALSAGHWMEFLCWGFCTNLCSDLFMFSK